MNSWQAFGSEYVHIDSKKSGQQLYLHELWHKVFLPAPGFKEGSRLNKLCPQ